MENFDLSWFTTVPGIAITVGVVLLLLSLIFLLFSRVEKKKYKDKMEKTQALKMEAEKALEEEKATKVKTPVMEEVKVENNVAAPSVVETNQTSPVVEPKMEPVVEAKVEPVLEPQMVSATPAISMEPVSPVAEPSMVSPVISQPEMVMPAPVETSPFFPTSSMEMPTMEPVVEIPSKKPDFVSPVEPKPEVVTARPIGMINQVSPVESTPVIQPQIVSSEPQIIASEPEFVSQQPQPEMVSEPVVEPTMVEETSSTSPYMNSFYQELSRLSTEVTTVPTNKDTPVIYGGASPVVNDIKLEPETHQIYGGADPLQNTQPIPKVVSNGEAYNASYSSIPEMKPIDDYMNQTIAPSEPVLMPPINDNTNYPMN